MLAAARARLPRVDFRQGDIAGYDDPLADLVFANAAMHWVPDHLGVMRRLAADCRRADAWRRKCPTTTTSRATR